MVKHHLRRAAKVLARATGVSLTAGAAAGFYFYHTEPGVERAARFWCHAVPILAHYRLEKWRAQDEEDAEKRYAKLHEQHAPDVRRAIEDLRGMFVKVAQVFSVRPEAVPEAIRIELRKLQDNAPPAKWDAVKMTIERDLGGALEDIFERIDREPLGAASIGQAHLVQWHGQDVVLKVKYPDSDSMMKADFWCLETLLWLMGNHDAVKIASLLRKQFEGELDYSQEARNLGEAYEAFSSSPEFSSRVAVPRPIPELTHGNVIGMTYLPGPKLETVLRARLEALGMNMKGRSFEDMLKMRQGQNLDGMEVSSFAPAPPSSLHESWALRCGRALASVFGMDALLWVVRSCADARLRLHSLASRSSVPEMATPETIDLASALQLLLDIHGFQLFFCPFINCDPHPGNILLLPDGRIGLIDFGQCKRLTDDQRIAFAELFSALTAAPAALDASHDADERIASAFTAMGVLSRDSQRRFLAMMPRLMFSRLQPQWFEKGYLKEVFAGDRVEKFPPDVFMVYRASMLLRGLCLTMQHNLSVADAWGSYATRWLQANALAASK